MTAQEFFGLDLIQRQQEIQKHAPFGSEAHKNAFEEMKRICAEEMGKDFAEQYFGEYE